MMGAPTFADRILEVFMENPNVEVTVEQIRKRTAPPQGQGVPYTVAQVQTAIANLRNRNQVPIESVVAGRVYRYTPGKKPTSDGSKRLFETLAVLKNGALLLEDENGAIFRAVELS